MVDPMLVPALRETLKQNEIGDASPYQLSFARLGKSGASFGFMQGDTNVSPLARATLRLVLDETELDGDAIIAELSRPLPDGNPLSPSTTATVDDALASEAGRASVDDMDQTLFSKVQSGLDICIDAAANREMAIDPVACLYIAPWINMTGAPTLLVAWLNGAAIHGVPAPTPPIVTEHDVVAYLQSTAYFEAHPRNFKHLAESVQSGAKLLPGA